MKEKSALNDFWFGNETLVLTRKNYFSWFEFLHPAKYAAQQSADKLNAEILAANERQQQLEAKMSLELTKEDNIKLIVALIIIAITMIYIY